MHTKLDVRRGPIRYFAKKAFEHYPNEFVAFLLGKERTNNKFEITALFYPEIHCQNRNKVTYLDIDIKNAKEKAKNRGLMFLGTLHTHIDWPPILSDVDYQGFEEDKEKLAGIMAIHNKRYQLVFWTKNKSLPCHWRFI